jgi:hypothetical protein
MLAYVTVSVPPPAVVPENAQESPAPKLGVKVRLPGLALQSAPGSVEKTKVLGNVSVTTFVVVVKVSATVTLRVKRRG